MNEKRRIEIVHELNKTKPDLTKQDMINMLNMGLDFVKSLDDKEEYRFCLIAFDDDKKGGVISVSHYNKDSIIRAKGITCTTMNPEDIGK